MFCSPDWSSASPVHSLIFPIQAERGLLLMRDQGNALCIVSFSRQFPVSLFSRDVTEVFQLSGFGTV